MGGITGELSQSNSINNCTNSGVIIGTGKYVGGIVGFSLEFGTINRCINNGYVEGKNAEIGGIVGQANQTTIKKCINNSQITHTGIGQNYQQDVGGIVGRLFNTGKIFECINNGEIISKAYCTAGIVGQCNDVIIEKCINNGKVTSELASRPWTGGIAGVYSGGSTNSIIKNCYNTAKIIGNNDVGGISGHTINTSAKFQNCYNIGDIKGNTNVGGLIGNNENNSEGVNSYYLIDTASRDFGNKTPTDYAKDKEFITTTFVTTANTSETIWQVKTNQNKGYPILIETNE